MTTSDTPTKYEIRDSRRIDPRGSFYIPTIQTQEGLRDNYAFAREREMMTYDEFMEIEKNLPDGAILYPRPIRPDDYKPPQHGKFVEFMNSALSVEMSKQDAVTPKPKVQVSVREVKWLNERRRQINALELEDIEWITEDGRVIPYNDKSVDDFKITGLSNIEFVEPGFHDGSVVIEHDDDDPWDSGLGKQAEVAL